MCTINLILVLWKYPETLSSFKSGTVKVWDGIYNIGKAFSMQKLRVLFLATFAFSFGWSFFGEFIPVYLIDKFGFTATGIGNYYAYNGICYGLSAGIFCAPVLKRYSPHYVFMWALLLCGAYMFLFLAIDSPHMLWYYIPPLCWLLALVFPTASALVSNSADKDSQGEVLGVYAFGVSCRSGCQSAYLRIPRRGVSSPGRYWRRGLHAA